MTEYQNDEEAEHLARQSLCAIMSGRCACIRNGPNQSCESLTPTLERLSKALKKRTKTVTKQLADNRGFRATCGWRQSY